MMQYLLDKKRDFSKSIKKMGLSFDSQHEIFALSETYSRMLRQIFGKLYTSGSIYEDRELTYRNKQYQTVVGENDIKFVAKKMKKYRIRYFIDTKKESLVVTTFRPDTIFADVAVAVHPMDKRYKKFVGKKVIVPIVNKAIPIISDERVDMTHEDGVKRITPGHDAFSLELAKDHNLSLNRYAVDHDGNFTELA